MAIFMMPIIRYFDGMEGLIVPKPFSSSNSTNTSRGYTIALISAAVLSTTAVFISYLTTTYSMPPLVLAFWRDVFTALTLLPVLLWSKALSLRVTRKDALYLLSYGLVLAAFNVFWTLSVAINGAAIATVLVYCSTAFTAILGWWLLKEQLGVVKLLVVTLTLGGCILVAGATDILSWQTNAGSLFTGVLSGLSYAVYSLMGRSASQRGLNPWVTLFYTFGFAASFLAIINLIPSMPGAATGLADYFWLSDSLQGWGVLFLLAAGPTVLGFGLYNMSLVLLPSSVANLVVTLEPVFTTIIAYVFLNERLTSTEIYGCAMILIGVFSLRIYEHWREKLPASSHQRACLESSMKLKHGYQSQATRDKS